MHKKRFFVLGTDQRQKYLAQLLERKGHIVFLSNEYVAGTYDAILLPVACTEQFMEQCLKKNNNEIIIFGYNILERASICEQAGARLVDYMKDENVAWLNAVATAEGAIAEALQEGGMTIFGSHCMVAGYGRCGSVLADRLKALGACVTILERKEERRAQARCLVDSVYDFLDVPEAVLTKQNYIFNTVPALVINATMLKRVNGQVAIIDLASKPGGVDFEYCRKKKIKAKLCLGLPGIYAPKTSSRILMEVIDKEMWGETS